MNMNELAKSICKSEGLKKETNIAQVKEIMRELSIELYVNIDTLIKFLDYGRKSYIKYG